MTLEDSYPLLTSKIMEYIAEVKLKDRSTDLSLIDIILDFSLKNGIDVEIVGDAIRSDVYLMAFIEKDCEYHGILKPDLEEW